MSRAYELMSCMQRTFSWYSLTLVQVAWSECIDAWQSSGVCLEPFVFTAAVLVLIWRLLSNAHDLL